MRIEDLKNGLSSAWDSVTDGWRRLMESATSALTHFRTDDKTAMPVASQVDDKFYFPAASWAMLAGTVFEDEKSVIVRLEIPGMEKEDIQIEVNDGHLWVSGEKRFEHEGQEGRYRVFQCAYGSFRRSVALPAPVMVDQARASYRNGVLRIELPKQEKARPKIMNIKVE